LNPQLHYDFVGRCDDLNYPGLQRQARASVGGGFRVKNPDRIERPWELIEREGGTQAP